MYLQGGTKQGRLWKKLRKSVVCKQTKKRLQMLFLAYFRVDLKKKSMSMWVKFSRIEEGGKKKVRHKCIYKGVKIREGLGKNYGSQWFMNGL